MTLVGNVLVGIGSALIAIAGLGILRLPDVYSRMHAATKAASLGLASILAGTALLFPGLDTAVKLVLAIAFQFLTAPVASHMIGRAAYRAGVPFWEGTLYDDLAEAEDIP